MLSEVIIASDSATVKTFGLFPDRGRIWLDFADFKHEYIEEVYQSELTPRI